MIQPGDSPAHHRIPSYTEGADAEVEFRIGTETWELYNDLIHLWAIYSTNCRGADSDGLRFVLRQAELLQELSDYPSESVNRVAREMGRSRRPFGVVQWVRAVRTQVIGQSRRAGAESLPTGLLIDLWRREPPPLWRVTRRLPRRPERTREAFKEMTDLAAFIDATYADDSDDIVRAADRVIAAYLAWVDDLEDLPSKLGRAQGDVADRLHDGVLSRCTLEKLDKIRVLLPDVSAHGRSTLARRFREINRPDLAIDVTKTFDASVPSHQFAVIARAAAHTDLRDLGEAYEDAVAVWNATQSPAAAVMLSKIARVEHEDAENLEWALEAWERERNEVTAQNLVTASLVREPSHEQARSVFEAEMFLQQRLAKNQPQRREQYVIVRAARVLLDDGRSESAQRAAEAVLEMHPDYFPAKQLLVDIRIGT